MINTTKSITIELPKPLYEIMIEVVCGYYSVTRKALFANSREQVIVDRRHILFYLMHKEAGMSDTEISQLLSIKRSVIQNAIQRVEFEKGKYKNRYSHDIDAISLSIGNMFNPLRDWVNTNRK